MARARHALRLVRRSPLLPRAACELAIIFALLALTGCRDSAEPPTFYSAVFEEAPLAPEIFLSDQFGAPFRLDNHDGQVVLLTFGYTHCPDVCPLTIVAWATARKELGEDGENLAYVFVTVDPERDSSERIGQYLEHFSIPVLGLTGTQDALAQVWADYGIYVEKGELIGDDPASYAMAHSAVTYVIDSGGRIRLAFPYLFPMEQIIHDLRLILEEKVKKS